MSSDSDSPPVAEIHMPKRIAWVWLIPAAAVLFCLVLFFVYVMKTGPVITIAMDQGFGLKPGDALRCRGIVVGQIESAELNKSSDAVILLVRIQPSAKHIARQGSRFWAVRPQLGLSGIGGLETIAGPRYLAVLPGTGQPQKRFVALDNPPVVETIDPNGLEIILTAQTRGSLVAGSPIMYRQVRIGTVLSVELASDASAVRIRAYIDPEDVALVRDNSKFWNVSGAQMHMGIRGIDIEVESLATLFDGGIALATPDPPGQRVGTGHRFILHPRPNDQWLKWRPALSVGSQLLPPDTPTPVMQRVTFSETAGTLFKRTRQEKCWALPYGAGLLLPGDILPQELTDQSQFQVAGQTLPLTEERITRHGELAVISLDIAAAMPWPVDKMRAMLNPENCLVLTTAKSTAMPLAAIRMLGKPGAWRIDPAVSFDSRSHGAAIIARADGALLGLLAVEDGVARILELPGEATAGTQ